MGRRAVQQFLAALVRGGKKSLEGCAGEVFGKGKELPLGRKATSPCCPEGEVGVECLLLKLFNFQSLYCVLYPVPSTAFTHTSQPGKHQVVNLSPSILW